MYSIQSPSQASLAMIIQTKKSQKLHSKLNHILVIIGVLNLKYEKQDWKNQSQKAAQAMKSRKILRYEKIKVEKILDIRKF